MRYKITKTYEWKETTCGDLVKKYNESGGNRYCEPLEFIDPRNPAEVLDISECWDWIQNQSPLKKVHLVDEVFQYREFIDE